MIHSYREYREYLAADAQHYQKQQGGFFKRLINRLESHPISNIEVIWKYVKELRYNEFHRNKAKAEDAGTFCKLYHSILYVLSNQRLKNLSYKTGFQIAPNTCGEGLQIWHYGYLIVNPEARIGKNATLYPGVEIGHKTPGEGAPQIGDNVFIGAGAKIFGNIRIGNNVTIAANAIVTKDIPDNSIVGGVNKLIDKSTNRQIINV